jgi:methylated-DNA-protein-cysteine methyltransferase related protein
MPSKSPAFARMKKALLALVADIPSGKVAQVGDVGLALNLPPRHVAYILSQLSDDEAAQVPWHRVVPMDGKFPTAAKQSVRHAKQIELLSHEGISLENKSTIPNLQGLIARLTDEYCNTFWADEDSRE